MQTVNRLTTAIGLIVLLAAPHPAAATQPTPEQACAEVTCRPATKVRLTLQDGQISEVVVKSKPYVIDGVVSILSGETIYFEAVPHGSTLAGLRFVSAVAIPERTLTFKFEQSLGIGLVLTVTNPFSEPFKYSAGIHRPGYEEFHRTSIRPVMRGARSWEHWPEPLVQLVLFDFRLVDANDQEAMVCD